MDDKTFWITSHCTYTLGAQNVPTVKYGTYLKYYHYTFITCIATLHNNPVEQPTIFHLKYSSTFLHSNGAKSQIKPCPTQFFTSSLCYSQQSTSSVDGIEQVQHQMLYTMFPHIFWRLSTISLPSIHGVLISP